MNSLMFRLAENSSGHERKIPCQHLTHDSALFFQDYSVLPAFSSVEYIATYCLQHQPDNTARSWIDAVAGMLQLRQARP